MQTTSFRYASLLVTHHRQLKNITAYLFMMMFHVTVNDQRILHHNSFGSFPPKKKQKNNNTATTSRY